MKITKAAEYAIRGIIMLARHGGRLDIKAIAASEGVSEVFLAKIFQRLVKAGLVRSKKGSDGGFELMKPAGSITVLEVIEAAQGEFKLRERMNDEKNGVLSKRLWGKIESEMKNSLENVSIARVCADMEFGFNY